MARGYPVPRSTISPSAPPATFSPVGRPSGGVANDNFARPSSFANDNWIKPQEPRTPRNLGGMAKYVKPPSGISQMAMAGFSLGSRVIPALRWASLAWRAYELWNNRPQQGIPEAGWEQNCVLGLWGGVSINGPFCQLGGNNVDYSVRAPGPMYQIDSNTWGVCWAVGFVPTSTLGPNFWTHDGVSDWIYNQTNPNAGQPLQQQQYAPYVRLGSSPRARSPIAYSPPRGFELPWRVPPMWDPPSAPIASPVPSPTEIPIPWPLIPLRRPDPWAVPPFRSDMGYSVPRAPLHWPRRDPYGDPTRQPRDLEVRPRGVSRPRPQHRFREPDKNKPKEKERKSKPVNAVAYKAFSKIASGITEGGDFITALWEALPEKFRKREMAKRYGKPPKLTTKMEQLWQNADKIDVNKAIDNIIENQIEDKVFGWFGKQAGKAAARDGRRDSYRVTRLGNLPGVSIKP